VRIEGAHRDESTERERDRETERERERERDAIVAQVAVCSATWVSHLDPFDSMECFKFYRGREGEQEREGVRERERERERERKKLWLLHPVRTPLTTSTLAHACMYSTVQAEPSCTPEL